MELNISLDAFRNLMDTKAEKDLFKKEMNKQGFGVD